MKYSHIIKLVSLVWIICLTSFVLGSPTIGSPAPGFELKDQYGKTQSLDSYKGQWLVLYFYPKDNTPGCTIEAGQFRDSKTKLAQLNTRVVGISLDDEASHLDFSNTLELNFSILSDENKVVAKKYQVLTDLGVIAYTSRETFIIDPNGIIAHHYDDVDPKTHLDLVLKKLNELKEVYK